jgi:hypothetical protein
MTPAPARCQESGCKLPVTCYVQVVGKPDKSYRCAKHGAQLAVTLANSGTLAQLRTYYDMSMVRPAAKPRNLAAKLDKATDASEVGRKVARLRKRTAKEITADIKAENEQKEN